MPLPDRASGVRALAVLLAVGLAVALSGCGGGGAGEFLAPQADVRVSSIAVPGGGVLAPIVSAGGGGTTTGTPSLEFPQVGIEVTLVNGVSLTYNGFAVEYLQADGATPLGVPAFRGFLSQFVQATLTADGPEPTVATLRIPVVSRDLRAVLAGADGRLGTDDDPPGTATARITITARDINGHDVSATARLTITSVPEADAQPR